MVHQPDKHNLYAYTVDAPNLFSFSLALVGIFKEFFNSCKKKLHILFPIFRATMIIIWLTIICIPILIKPLTFAFSQEIAKIDSSFLVFRNTNSKYMRRDCFYSFAFQGPNFFNKSRYEFSTSSSFFLFLLQLNPKKISQQCPKNCSNEYIDNTIEKLTTHSFLRWIPYEMVEILISVGIAFVIFIYPVYLILKRIA